MNKQTSFASSTTAFSDFSSPEKSPQMTPKSNTAFYQGFSPKFSSSGRERVPNYQKHTESSLRRNNRGGKLPKLDEKRKSFCLSERSRLIYKRKEEIMTRSASKTRSRKKFSGNKSEIIPLAEFPDEVHSKKPNHKTIFPGFWIYIFFPFTIFFVSSKEEFIDENVKEIKEENVSFLFEEVNILDEEIEVQNDEDLFEGLNFVHSRDLVPSFHQVHFVDKSFRKPILLSNLKIRDKFLFPISTDEKVVDNGESKFGVYKFFLVVLVLFLGLKLLLGNDSEEKNIIHRTRRRRMLDLDQPQGNMGLYNRVETVKAVPTPVKRSRRIQKLKQN
eukprot:snap_masked-scaffold_54-processed-gene-0.21-mRNA-1 protein AED:1.00 eAED:1.00 QI:0/0/0/0/1/1/2/0/330